jgi:hypothetical protein
MSVQKVVNNDNAADMNNTYENSIELLSSSVFSFSITVTGGGTATAIAPAAGTVLEDGQTRLTGAVTSVGAGPIQTLTITYGNYPSSLADGDKPTDETHAVTVNSTNDDPDDVDNAVYTARITSDSAASALVIVVSRFGNAATLTGAGVTLDIEIRKRGNALA